MPDRKEYIERGALIAQIKASTLYADFETEGRFVLGGVVDLINKRPAADVVEVVRCRECKKRYVPAYCALWYGQINDEHGCRDIFLRAYNDDFYCAYGERKDGADNA